MKRKIMYLRGISNCSIDIYCGVLKELFLLCILCLFSFFLSACGKAVSSEIDTKTTESSQEFREENNIVNEQPENEEIVDAADYITENYAIKFDEAEMILTEIPEEYAELIPDRELSFILDNVKYILPCNVQNFLNNGWEFNKEHADFYVEKLDARQYQDCFLSKDGVNLNVGIVNMSDNICNIERCDVFAIVVDGIFLSKFESPDGVVYGDTQDVIREKMGDYIVEDAATASGGFLWWGNRSDLANCGSLVLYSCAVKGRVEWLKDSNGSLILDENGVGTPYLADENGELLHPIEESDRVLNAVKISVFRPWEIE